MVNKYQVKYEYLKKAYSSMEIKGKDVKVIEEKVQKYCRDNGLTLLKTEVVKQ